MRKYTKKLLLEAVGKINKANKRIGEEITKGITIHNAEQVLAILTVEQETAIMMGEEIEKLEGTGTEIVKLLEEYCELLWMFSQTQKVQEHKRLWGKMNAVIGNVTKQLKALKEQYEVVFFPYKASMWDCMESVWMAAKEDPDCITYVVPIPYYERAKDGSLEKMFYEADIMPNYVEITHYDNYLLEERHPEIIYIHNPYDDMNLVTCVHPRYFSPNLKQNTEMLVYIPYFMAGRGAYDKNHCNLPAYQYVDKIIVQDESKFDGLIRVVPEDKILVLGSPKVDRILRLQKERQKLIETVIPQSWRKKILGKKVFLYNISISGILQNSSTAFDKIRFVLSKFKKRNDIVLLWRPHPLIESTLKSLRPSMYQEYMQIKEEFIEADMGIYDDTGDAGVSVVISDAYLGENTSSLIHYFGVLEKPILFIDWQVRTELTCEERRTIYTASCFVEDEKAYFVPRQIGWERDLFSVDLADGKIQHIEKMPGKMNRNMEWGSYLDIIEINNNIIMPAYNADETYVYDRITKRALKILLSEECEKMNFDKAFPYKESVILKPKCYPAVVKIDIDNYQIEEYKECVASFVRENREEPMFLGACVMKDNFLYMAAAMESKMLIVNVDDGSFVIERIGDFDFGYSSMVYDGQYFWLTGWKENCIVRWGEKEARKYNLGDIFVNQGMNMLVDKAQKLWLFNNANDVILQINKEFDKIEKHIIPIDLGEVSGRVLGKTELQYAFIEKIDEDRVLIFRHCDCSFILINLNDTDIKVYPVRMTYEQMIETEHKKILNEKLRKIVIPYAVNDAKVELEEFIDFVIHVESGWSDKVQGVYNDCLENLYENSGMKIHSVIKSYVEGDKNN